MANENIYDEALKGVVEVVDGVSDEIAKDFKGANPFDKKKVPTKDLLSAYDRLTPFQKQAFIDRYGQLAVNFFDELEMNRW